MTTVFGPDYAGIYDALYRGKDYAGEVELIEQLLMRHGASGPHSILDLGCGTGNHGLALARHGHRVTGVDRSVAMLAEAHSKAAAEFPPGIGLPVFLEGDIRHLDLGERFDAALMMFTVLGYQCEDADLLSALAAVHSHLAPGGLFIFDVWNGPAVLAQRPRDRTGGITDGSTTIFRRTRTRLNPGRRLCRVHFDIERMDSAGSSQTWEEEHVVRYFFPEELRSVLGDSGFGLLDLRRFPDGEAPPDEKAWNVIGIARAR
jgi:SAM-dependent methyltransferase